MKVLVTGATSLLGRSTIERLIARGDEVTSLQRSPGPVGIREVLGDIADQDIAVAATAKQDAVIHLAARVGVTGSWQDFERTNIVGTKTIIDAAKQNGVSRVVHVSSPSVAHSGSALVGASAASADPSTTRGHYATSKAKAELYALSRDDDSCSVVAIRPHLVWGPGDTQLIGRIVERSKQGRLVLIGNGSALIDTTYIDNAADALVAAVDQAPQLGGRSLVVSNGQPRTVRELLEHIVTAAGLEPPTRNVPAPVAFVSGLAFEKIWDRTERSDDPPVTSFLAEQLSTAHWFDQRETRRALAWQPTVSLEEGFRRLQAWLSETAVVSR